MKRYLQSVEEVVKALEEGKKILDIANMDCYYKVIAGKYCYCDLKFNTTVINISIVFEDNSKRYYTEEPEQLKFEVNRAYKTREGLKVFLFEKRENKNNEIVYCFVGVDMNYKIYDFTTGKNGKYCIDNRDSSFDIVGYWEEEK